MHVLAACRCDMAQELVSHDCHSNTYHYKFTFSLEIVPVCKVCPSHLFMFIFLILVSSRALKHRLILLTPSVTTVKFSLICYLYVRVCVSVCSGQCGVSAAPAGARDGRLRAARGCPPRHTLRTPHRPAHLPACAARRLIFPIASPLLSCPLAELSYMFSTVHTRT